MKTTFYLLFLAAAYAGVKDDAPVFMLTSEFNQRIQDERITAARDAIDATEPRRCTWRDLFEDNKQ